MKTVQGNLAKGVAHTGKVYGSDRWQDKKLAVFGVAMNDAKHGEGWWVKKVGSDHIAALPWEIVIVNGKVSALYGRYRTALGWPTLGMGTFMSILGSSRHDGGNAHRGGWGKREIQRVLNMAT